MPEVKNEKGEVIANMPYNQAGQQQAQAMVAENPGYTINDASQRNVQTYAGGGKTGYNVPMYKEGGKTRIKDEDMVLDIKNREKVKSYEDRFKDKKETQAPTKRAPKKGLKPSKQKKGSSLRESLKKAKEYEKYKPRKYKKGGSVPKGRKRRSPHMSEATHPGVDKVRNEMIKNEADMKKQPRAVYKTKQQVLRDKLKRIKHKGDK